METRSDPGRDLESLKIQCERSFYRELYHFQGKRQTLVMNETTGRIYLKKELEYFAPEVLHYLKQHKNRQIPELHDYQERDDGTVSVLEEYIQGDTLEWILEDAKPGEFTETRMRAIVTELCKGLEFLHQADPPIIHRDLKASNIMIADDGRVLLIDYDAAKVYHDESHRDTVLIGTEGSAAPEQYGFAQSDARTDIYAMGVLLKRMLDGIPDRETGRSAGAGAARWKTKASGKQKEPMISDTERELPLATTDGERKWFSYDRNWRSAEVGRLAATGDGRMQSLHDRDRHSAGTDWQTVDGEWGTNGISPRRRRRYLSVAEKCMEMDPKNRYPDVAAFRSDFLAAGGRTSADPEPKNGRQPGARRNSKGRFLFPPPGFRSGTPWKMAVAIAGYLLILDLALTMPFEHSDPPTVTLNRIVVFFLLLTYIDLFTGWTPMFRKIPFLSHPAPWVRGLAYVAISAVILFMWILILSLLIEFFRVVHG